MTEQISYIPTRLKSAVKGGYVTGAGDIIDDEHGITQDVLNSAILEEKIYTPDNFSGMGRVVLKKNILNGVNTLTQDMFYKGEVGSREPNTNTIFVIQYDFTLGEDITIPEGCVLEFDGGSLNNGTVVGQNTSIKISQTPVFKGIEISGTFYDNTVCADWFEWSENPEDNTKLFENITSISHFVIFGSRTYYLKLKDCVLSEGTHLVGVDNSVSIFHKTKFNLTPSDNNTLFLIGLRNDCGVHNISIDYAGGNNSLDVIRVDRYFGIYNRANYVSYAGICIDNVQMRNVHYDTYKGRNTLNPIGVHIMWTDVDSYNGKYVDNPKSLPIGFSYKQNFNNLQIFRFKYGIKVEAGEVAATENKIGLWFNSVYLSNITIAAPIGIFFEEKDPSLKIIKRFAISNYMYQSTNGCSLTIPSLSEQEVCTGIAGVASSVILNSYDYWDAGLRFALDGDIYDFSSFPIGQGASIPYPGTANPHPEDGFDYPYTDGGNFRVMCNGPKVHGLFLRNGGGGPATPSYNSIISTRRGFAILPDYGNATNFNANDPYTGVAITNDPSAGFMMAISNANPSIKAILKYGADINGWQFTPRNSFKTVISDNTKMYCGSSTSLIIVVSNFTEVEAAEGVEERRLFESSCTTYIINGTVRLLEGTTFPNDVVIYFNGGKIIGSNLKWTRAKFYGDVVKGLTDAAHNVSSSCNFFVYGDEHLPPSDKVLDGQSFFVREWKKPVYWYNGARWLDCNGHRGAINTGTTAERPSELVSNKSDSAGFEYYDTTLKRPIWSDQLRWRDSEGIIIGTPRSGDTASRPNGFTGIQVGFIYFDIDLGKPIFAKTVNSSSPYTVTWVDATGATV